MNIKSPEVVIYVSYQGNRQDHFDREYYVNSHLPLVMNMWGKYGLLRVSAFFPAQEEPGTVAICECIFRDEAAVEATFSSPEVVDVMADVPLFTHLQPVRMHAQTL